MHSELKPVEEYQGQTTHPAGHKKVSECPAVNYCKMELARREISTAAWLILTEDVEKILDDAEKNAGG
jgi:hypothetical protein